MGYIYKITNTINGKAYIGQTYRAVQERFVEHLRMARKDRIRYKSLLYNAIKKYGEKAFVVETLEECPNELLNDREAFWIKTLGTYRAGYNISLVCQKGSKYRISDIASLWSKGFCANEIADKVGISKQVVLDRLHDCGVASKDIMSRGNSIEHSNHKHKMVARISQDGAIKIYKSMLEASKDSGVSVGNICEICKGTKKAVKGYSFAYFSGENGLQNLEYPTNVKPYEKEVHQYTKDGHFIRSFASMSEASRVIGGKGVGTIKVACLNPKRTGYGYRWSFEKQELLQVS